MTRRINILNLTTDFGQGGAERVFNQLGEALSERYNVLDCVFNQDRKREYVSNNRVVDLETPAAGSILMKLWSFLVRIRRLNRVKKLEKIDVTISHLEGADYINILSRHRDKTILCIHGSKLSDQAIRGWLGWLRKNILVRYLYRRATVIVTVSEGIAGELVNHFGIERERIVVIRNFFDVDRIRELSAEPLPPQLDNFFEANEVLIFAGRLAPQKNPLFLPELMHSLLKKRTGVKLMVLGAGELYEQMVQRAQALGLSVARIGEPFNVSNDIVFLGYQRNPFALMSRSDIFLFPSLWEGFPLALCEAMVSKVFVIANDCPTGPREILGDNVSYIGKDPALTSAGLLMPLTVDPEKTIEQWTDVIVKMLLDGDRREQITNHAAERIMQLDRARIMPEWFHLIDKLVRNHSSFMSS